MSNSEPPKRADLRNTAPVAVNSSSRITSSPTFSQLAFSAPILVWSRDVSAITCQTPGDLRADQPNTAGRSEITVEEHAAADGHPVRHQRGVVLGGARQVSVAAIKH